MAICRFGEGDVYAYFAGHGDHDVISIHLAFPDEREGYPDIENSIGITVDDPKEAIGILKLARELGLRVPEKAFERLSRARKLQDGRIVEADDGAWSK